jgi:hypothetical protein
MGRLTRIQTFDQLIKFSEYRQFSVPDSPLFLVAKRILHAWTTFTNSRFLRNKLKQSANQTTQDSTDKITK